MLYPFKKLIWTQVIPREETITPIGSITHPILN
jgi:hypothetical protein